MNDLEFNRHLKDLAHGHHYPEEHDVDQPATPKTAARRTQTVKQELMRRYQNRP
jgi:hypothetical protein